MKAVVMAGGEGSRLRPLTSRRPKPLVPVVGRPCMEHVLRLLRRHGITEVIITLQYLGASIRNYFGDGAELGMQLHYVVEDRPLGTAGSVKNAASLLDETFIVISGDALTDIDLTQAVAFHRDHGAQATLVLSRVANPLEYGVVITAADGHVERFLEKPSWGEVFSDQVNTGIYVIEPQVLAYCSEGEAADWSQDVFPEMLRRRDSLWATVGRGYWCDIGSVQSYLQANWDALEGRVVCEIAGQRTGPAQWTNEGASVADTARIEGPAFIGRDAVIGHEAFLNGPVVVDRYAVVDAGAKVSNSVLWPQVYIGERSRLRQTVVCSSATLKPDVLLQDSTVIGDDCTIGAGSVVQHGVRIWPGKEIEAGSVVHESVIWAGTWRSSLFSKAGITGIINVELTPEWCARLGAAWSATQPRGSELAICRDRSPGSGMIKRAMISGMLSAGAKVIDLAELPVPVTCHYTRESSVVGTVHVLASPLDARSADLLVLDDRGMALDRRQERKLENTFFREDFRRVLPGEITDITDADGALAGYARHAISQLKMTAIRDAHPRVLVDFGFSSASMILPHLLREAHVEAITLRSGFEEDAALWPQARNREEELDQASAITKTVAALLGSRLDPSSQRLALIDDEGWVISYEEATCLLTLLTLRTKGPGTIVAPVSASRRLEQVAANNGGKVVLTRADTASIVRAATRNEALFAFDEAGGFIWPSHLSAYDAMFTLLTTVEMLVTTQNRLSELRRELPPGAHLEASVACPWDVKGEVMRRLIDTYRSERLDLTDGLKVDIDRGWVLIIPEPDRPSYRVIVSVAGETDAERELAGFVSAVSDTVDQSVRAGTSGSPPAGSSPTSEDLPA
ncbi:MAG TPA: sugar phosphate nucleotidyltransferase [Candidatus Dormibacteraeota bacterium]|nr:sugar phosphate nucleotidyltransferase [Candidatus Dormibacteraeota bacterium]